MKKLFYIKFWGDYACFTDPLHPVERQTYPFPTHSALNNMIKSIFWHPEMHEYGGAGYQIKRIAIKNPIVKVSLTRNEVTKVIKKDMKSINVNAIGNRDLKISGVRTQHNTILLKNVEYVVEFYINFPDGEFKRTDKDTNINYRGKYEDILFKRLTTGSCYKTPYFGCREFSASFETSSINDMIGNMLEVPNMKIDPMLYETNNLNDISKIEPTFCPVELKHGIVTYPSWEELRNK